MTTLQQLLEQQAALTKQIDATRREEKSAAIAEVKNLMEHHGLSVSDLGLSKVKASRDEKSGKVAAKYRDKETGSTWSGRGLKPRWLQAAVNAGKKIEDFAV